MSVKNKMFQPGAILHEVIVGVLRSKGTGFEAWCKDNEVNPSTARMATYGQSGGDKGQAMLDRIIDAAGRDVVAAVYKQRIETEAAKLSGVAA